MIVFFCGLQSLSFGQLELRASAPAPLTETTLHGSVVTLTLQGGPFPDNIQSRELSFSIGGVWADNVERLSDTELRVRLGFSGDFDQDQTLTIEAPTTQWPGWRSDSAAELPGLVTATTESITATTTPAPLTEATLHNSTVTLTLQGRTFEDNIGRSSVSVSGIWGVSVDEVKRLSDTQISVRLEFNIGTLTGMTHLPSR